MTRLAFIRANLHLTDRTKPHRWTTADLRYLRDNRHLTDKELAANMALTESQIKKARWRYGILKPRNYSGFLLSYKWQGLKKSA